MNFGERAANVVLAAGISGSRGKGNSGNEIVPHPGSLELGSTMAIFQIANLNLGRMRWGQTSPQAGLLAWRFPVTVSPYRGALTPSLPGGHEQAFSAVPSMQPAPPQVGA